MRLAQPQRLAALEPLLEQLLVLGQLLPGVASLHSGARLQLLSHLPHMLVGHFPRLEQAQHLGLLEVTAHRLAVQAGLSRDAPDSLPSASPPQHFLHVHHGQLPVTHRHLPTATRAVIGQHLVSVPVACPGANRERSALRWSHDLQTGWSLHSANWHLA